MPVGVGVGVGVALGPVALVGVGVAVGLGDGMAVADGLAVAVGAAVGATVAVGLGDGVTVAVGAADGGAEGAGPAAGAVGVGTADADGSLGAGPEAPAPALSDGVPTVPGASGPHDGPIVGTGGGLSMVGSTATGRVGPAGAGIDPGSVAGVDVESPPTAGVSTAGEGAGVVLGSGAWKAEGALLEGVVPPPGVDSVAGSSWLDPTMTNATVPATTIAAGAAHFPTITPRMLVAPKPRARLNLSGNYRPTGAGTINTVFLMLC